MQLPPLPSPLLCLFPLLALLAACGDDARTDADTASDAAAARDRELQDQPAFTGKRLRNDLLPEDTMRAGLADLPPGSRPHHSLWDNGNARAQGYLCDDLPVGDWVYWHRSGQPAMHGHYVYGGKQHGLWRTWHENGTHRSEGQFLFGVEHGEWAYWLATGRPTMRGRYHEGEKHGLWTSWHPGGVRASEGVFYRGERVGRWRFWDESGRELEPVQYNGSPELLSAGN